jgi:glyoxylase-like metal-dependent hydrolase (beta-lactamase superfamily II)
MTVQSISRTCWFAGALRGDWIQLASCAVMVVLLLAGGTPAFSEDANDSTKHLVQLSTHHWVFQGASNIGIVRDGENALLIDCGDERVVTGLAQLGVKQVQQVLVTHYHRDQTCAWERVISPDTQLLVPEKEREYFLRPEKYWNDDKYLWRVYRTFRPHPLMPTRPIPATGTVAAGQTIAFGPARIRVLDTPGHTIGSVSYSVEVDGQRVVYGGDTICGPGQLWDLYSLQAGMQRHGQSVGAYHGFMGDQETLVDSLKRIKRVQPDRLIPAHGSLMADPANAIDQLIGRLSVCYENYVSISALRHYFPKLFLDFEGRPGQMPIRAGIEPPDCLRHFGTTWMLVADKGDAFVMDVGSPQIVEQLQKLQEQGEIRNIEGLWVTHYHFDHTDGIPKFQQVFDCPCYTDRRLADVLLEPTAWRLPCLAPDAIRVERPMPDAEPWQWRGFQMTSFFFPGQTLYHAALLVERDDLRMLFVGDSHTMAGLDDYCMHNRNWLGEGVGFMYCLDLIERLQPTHMFNCHVDQAFTFSPEEIEFMRAKLRERERLFGEVVPWPHANFGLDSSWIRCDPYLQEIRAGETCAVNVVVTNHADASQAIAARLRVPSTWPKSNSLRGSCNAQAKQETLMSLKVTVPSDLAPGRYVLPLDLQFGSRDLPSFAEVMIDVVP